MATIVTYNPARTQEIIDKTVVEGSVNGTGDLILEHRDGTTFNGGSVKAPKGDRGPERPLNVGQIVLYAGTVPPQGWALCDGAHVSRVNFPDLFAAIGTKYGAGDGSTTFSLPNLKGRVAVGLDSAQTEFDALGDQGGAKTHTLTTSEIPAHTHGILGYSSKDDENFTGNVGRFNASDATVNVYDKDTGWTGGAGAHNNLQPYATFNYIIALGIAGPQAGGLAAARYFTDTGIGTTTQRDTQFGVPTTLAGHVALANQRPVWYNTDTGWEESYYAVSGSAGLTALGLVTGAVAGWYPVDKGPYFSLDGLQYVPSFNTLLNSWANVQNKGGSSWFTLSGSLVQLKKHGRYDIQWWTQIYEGPGAPDFVLQVFAADGVTFVNGVSGGGFEKNASFWIRPHLDISDLIIAPNYQVGIKLQTGTMSGGGMTVNLGGVANQSIGGHLSIRYVGPPLTSE